MIFANRLVRATHSDWRCEVAEYRKKLIEDALPCRKSTTLRLSLWRTYQRITGGGRQANVVAWIWERNTRKGELLWL